MFFLTVNNADIEIDIKSFTWRSYSVVKVLSIVGWVELINKYKFVQTTLNKNSETFVMYVSALKALGLPIYPPHAPMLAVL